MNRATVKLQNTTVDRASVEERFTLLLSDFRREFLSRIMSCLSYLSSSNCA